MSRVRSGSFFSMSVVSLNVYFTSSMFRMRSLPSACTVPVVWTVAVDLSFLYVWFSVGVAVPSVYVSVPVSVFFSR